MADREIRTTKIYGYCFGVKNAMNALFNEIEHNNGKRVYTFGQIIHNNKINEDLRSRNVIIEENIDNIPENSKVFIRTHGVSPDIIRKLKEKNMNIVDVTCPKVRVIHRIAEKSKYLIIAGDENHPEIIGIVGHCPNSVIVVKDKTELACVMDKLRENKYTFVAQTTFNIKKWEEMKAFLAQQGIDIEIIDTICHATSDRQKEVENLAKESDFFIVIGGKNSSNTNKLYEIASKYCETIHIENLKEMPMDIIGNYKKIGLSSGASTPAEALEEVISNMMNENEKVLHEDQNIEEDIDFAQAMEATIKIIRNGQRVSGTVSAINGTEIQVDLGGKHSGFIPTIEFADDEVPVKVGDEIDALVVKVNDVEGTVLLSKKKIDAIRGFEKIEKAKDNNDILTGKVTEVVKGGLVVNVAGVRVFVPGSLVSLRRNADLEEFAGKEVKLHIISTEDGKRRKIVGSIRSVLAEEQEAKAAVLWESIEVGKKYTGKVTSVTSFGAFVDIGGADGLVHISDMSWAKINNPASFLQVGDTVEVIVKSANPETKKISLTMKNPEENPWEIIKTKYKEGDVIDVKVLKIMPYGAFVSVIPGIDGLIHISQLADSHVDNVAAFLTIGQTVAAKIVEINYETKKVSLSIKGIAGGHIPEDIDDAVVAESENVALVTESEDIAPGTEAEDVAPVTEPEDAPVTES